MDNNDPETQKKTRGRKKGATVNKTQEIRRVAREMLDIGVRPRPTEIAEKLRAQNVEVSGPQVSMALKGTGMEYRTKRPQDCQLPDPKESMKGTSTEDLLVVKEFVKRLGSMEKALGAISAYRHLLHEDKT